MKKFLMGGVLFLGMLLFSGCTGSQPQFNPTPNTYVLVEGKYFLVPQNTQQTSVRISQETANFHRQNGLYCNKGDIRWMSIEAKKTYNEHVPEELKEASRKGLTGCARPLTDQEVQQRRAYLAQQEKINNDPRVVAARIQANAINNAAAQQSFDAMQMRQQMQLNQVNQQLANTANSFIPKTYNVYHYGY